MAYLEWNNKTSEFKNGDRPGLQSDPLYEAMERLGFKHHTEMEV